MKQSDLPPNQTKNNLAVAAKNFSEVSATAVFLVGILVLIGWQFDIGFLKSVHSGFVTMKPNTALGVVFLGLSLWLLQEKRMRSWLKYLGWGSALFVLFIGLTAVLEHITGINLGVDMLLFRESSPAPFTTFPGRMALNTAFCFVFFGISLLYLNIKTKNGLHLSVIPAVFSGLVALVVIVGYFYDISQFYFGAKFDTLMALHTALAFFIASLGVLFARPEGNLTRVFIGANLSGVTIRRLFPLAFLVPLLFIWLEQVGNRYHLYGHDFGMSITAAASIVVLATLIWVHAVLMEKKEDARLKAVKELVIATEEARRLSFLVENTIEAVAIVDLEDHNALRYVNSAWEKMFGYKKNEVENKREPLIIDAIKKNPALYKKFKASIAAHVPFYAEMEWERKDGKLVPVEVFTTPTQDPNTGKYIWFNTIRDISERKQAQGKLLKEKRVSELLAKDLKKFQLAVDSSSDHIMITDAEGKILYGNKAIESITGYAISEIIGKTVGQVWGGHMPKEFYVKLWHKIKTEKKMFVGELTNYRKDGTPYTAEVRISPILFDDGEVNFFVGVERDITRMKEVDKMKSEFVSLTSHQLSTPLTAIKWYVEILLKKKHGSEDKKNLKQIYASNERMIRLISDLLDVSRIESGNKFAIILKPKNIASLIKEIVDTSLISIKTKHRQGVIKLEDKFPEVLKLEIDENKIRQVFQNLIDNAINYSVDRIKISVGCKEEGGQIVFHVKDTGIGIPKVQQGRVFEKFFRADNTALLKSQGTGLGLYLSKAIVEGHGGKIRF
ncbi:MAG: hypothetical protein A2534_02515, partial [Candidatus Magasanikbacteria bacterium RIFOXYD2_FULL_39_9]